MGNVATENVLYALHDSHYRVEGEPNWDAIVDIGAWVSTALVERMSTGQGEFFCWLSQRQRRKLSLDFHLLTLY
jgi:hypothetical protein